MYNKTNEVAKAINNRGINAVVNTVNKNGIDKYGITLGTGNVRPSLYLRKTDLNRDPEEIANDIINIYESLDEKEALHYQEESEKVITWDFVKDKVFPCLTSRPTDLVSVPFLDFRVYFKVQLDSSSAFSVTYPIFNCWHISEEELLKVAVENMNHKIAFTDIFSFLTGIVPEEKKKDIESIENEPMFIVTTENSYFGAGAMLCTSIFEQIANKVNTDLAVVPSSIHELLVIPLNAIDIDDLSEMINMVNSTEVSPDDYLSNHPYFYRRAVGKIEAK